MAEKKTETKTAKPTKSKKAEPKPKRAPKEKEDLCVFALRMTEPERTKLHATAGPRGAARFARAVLNAAAQEDEGAFKTALAEARKLNV